MSKAKPRRTDGRSLSGATVGVLLGSGLGDVSAPFPVERELPFTGVPGLSDAGVEGHRGVLKLVAVQGHKCLFVEGRKHFYEGDRGQIDTLVSFIAKTGVRELVVTSASGSLDSALPPGQLVLARDVLDLQLRRPDRSRALHTMRPGAPGKGLVPGRLPLGQPLDGSVGRRLEQAASSAQVSLRRGVIACNAGPAYETPAEVEALRRMGASVVTMSGAPEISHAQKLGIRVASLAVVTNWASGVSISPLSHEEVLTAARGAAGQLREILQLYICNKKS